MESASRGLDIINVAGLMIGEGNGDGLAKHLSNRGYVRSVRTVYPTPPSRSMEPPEKSVERAIAQVLWSIEEIKKEYGDSNAVLIGRSYGALMALMVACRMKFEDILKAILIEGPLHPGVTVEPPKLLPILAVCASHYKQRSLMVEDTMRSLAGIGTQRIVVISNRRDAIVTPEAQVLPGDFLTLDLQSEDIEIINQAGDARGLIIKLPTHLGGVTGGLKAALPADYRDHLFWSDEKFRFIMEIIKATTAKAILQVNARRAA